MNITLLAKMGTYRLTNYSNQLTNQGLTAAVNLWDWQLTWGIIEMVVQNWTGSWSQGRLWMMPGPQSSSVLWGETTRYCCWSCPCSSVGQGSSALWVTGPCKARHRLQTSLIVQVDGLQRIFHSFWFMRLLTSGDWSAREIRPCGLGTPRSFLSAARPNAGWSLCKPCKILSSDHCRLPFLWPLANAWFI